MNSVLLLAIFLKQKPRDSAIGVPFNGYHLPFNAIINAQDTQEIRPVEI